MLSKSTYIDIFYFSGKVSQVELASAPISEGFRSGIFTMMCASSWMNEYLDAPAIANVRTFASELYKMGKNTYYNEPDLDVTEWKNEFWAPHYEQLEAAKRKYDPDNFFTCKKCVGSDLNTSN